MAYSLTAMMLFSHGWLEEPPSLQRGMQQEHLLRGVGGPPSTLSLQRTRGKAPRAAGGVRGAWAPTCPNGQNAMTSESLYFGMAKPDGTVTALEWQGILNESITPRSPEGLSVWPASGQWMFYFSVDSLLSRVFLIKGHPEKAATLPKDCVDR